MRVIIQKGIGSVLLLVAICWASGCTVQTVEPPITVSPLFISTLVEETSPALPGKYLLPTPSLPDVGVVGGVVLRDIAGRPLQAMRGGFLLLSAVHIDQGQAAMAIVEEDTDPRTTADKEGMFVFTEVPPGTYALVYKTPAGVFVLREPDSGKDLLIRVKGGDVVDLGELRYDLPY